MARDIVRNYVLGLEPGLGETPERPSTAARLRRGISKRIHRALSLGAHDTRSVSIASDDTEPTAKSSYTRKVERRQVGVVAIGCNR